MCSAEGKNPREAERGAEVTSRAAGGQPAGSQQKGYRRGGKEKRMCSAEGMNPREAERGADGTKENRSYRSHQIYLLLLGTNT